MSDQYYRFFPGDYIRDTQRLSLLEHGAYRVLLDSYYCEEFLPSNRESLYHICRAFKKDERKAVDVVVERYFKENGENNRLFNKKAEEEIKRRRLFLEQQNRKSKLGVEARRQEKQTDNQEPTGQPTGQPEGEPNHLHLHILKKEKDYCPQKDIVDLYHQLLPSCRKVKFWNEKRQAKLRARWNEDKERQNLEWWMTYFKNVSLCFWFTEENKKNWYPNLEWLVESGNMVNVLEKKYYSGDRK